MFQRRLSYATRPVIPVMVMSIVCLMSGAEGKRLRPTILMLLASTLSAVDASAASLSVDDSPASMHPSDPRRRQQRIAEASTPTDALQNEHALPNSCRMHPNPQ